MWPGSVGVGSAVQLESSNWLFRMLVGRLALVVRLDDGRHRLRLHVREVLVRHAAPDADQVLAGVAVIGGDHDVVGGERRPQRLDRPRDVDRPDRAPAELVGRERALVVRLDERDRLRAVVDHEGPHPRAGAEHSRRAPDGSEAVAAEVHLAVGRRDRDRRIERPFGGTDPERPGLPARLALVHLDVAVDEDAASRVAVVEHDVERVGTPGLAQVLDLDQEANARHAVHRRPAREGRPVAGHGEGVDARRLDRLVGPVVEEGEVAARRGVATRELDVEAEARPAAGRGAAQDRHLGELARDLPASRRQARSARDDARQLGGGRQRAEHGEQDEQRVRQRRRRPDE